MQQCEPKYLILEKPMQLEVFPDDFRCVGNFYYTKIPFVRLVKIYFSILNHIAALAIILAVESQRHNNNYNLSIFANTQQRINYVRVLVCPSAFALAHVGVRKDWPSRR